MWRHNLVLLTVSLFGAHASAEGVPSASEAGTKAPPVPAAIQGVWKITELASRAAGAAWEVRSTPYLSQYIFTAKHYSYMYVLGPNPRKQFAGDPNRPSDAEKAEAYSSVVAATGTFSLSGQTLTLTALVHKNPNEMTGVALTYKIEVDRNTMRMVIDNPPFLPGHEWRTVLTRVE